MFNVVHAQHCFTVCRSSTVQHSKCADTLFMNKLASNGIFLKRRTKSKRKIESKRQQPYPMSMHSNDKLWYVLRNWMQGMQEDEGKQKKKKALHMNKLSYKMGLFYLHKRSHWLPVSFYHFMHVLYDAPCTCIRYQDQRPNTNKIFLWKEKENMQKNAWFSLRKCKFLMSWKQLFSPGRSSSTSTNEWTTTHKLCDWKWCSAFCQRWHRMCWAMCIKWCNWSCAHFNYYSLHISYRTRCM